MTASTGGRDPEDQIDATKFGKITHHRVGKFFPSVFGHCWFGDRKASGL